MTNKHHKAMACALFLLPLIACSANNAEERFAISFSGSGAFDCWADADKISIGVNSGLPYGMQRPAGLSDEELRQGLKVEIETFPSKNKNHIDRLWGIASFADDDKKISVPLNNGKKAHFDRFGATPNWPFKDKKDSQLFFTFRVDDGPVYKCKALYQPDQ